MGLEPIPGGVWILRTLYILIDDEGFTKQLAKTTIMGAPNIVSGVTRIISHLQTGGGGLTVYNSTARGFFRSSPQLCKKRPWGHAGQWFVDTPWKISGRLTWNIKITQLKRNIIFPNLHYCGSMWIFRGVPMIWVRIFYFPLKKTFREYIQWKHSCFADIPSWNLYLLSTSSTKLIHQKLQLPWTWKSVWMPWMVPFFSGVNETSR